jgi:predicted nucleic acid-binding Zn ribbon protein
MALIIDHVNGVATDNRLENLQIVCPNCAATLDTHCGRNVLLARACVVCGRSFQPTDRRQRHCSRTCSGRTNRNRERAVAARRVERPPYDRLMREIRHMGWSAVGRKYGVSDNAVRKWVRWYEAEAA